MNLNVSNTTQHTAVNIAVSCSSPTTSASFTPGLYSAYADLITHVLANEGLFVLAYHFCFEYFHLLPSYTIEHGMILLIQYITVYYSILQYKTIIIGTVSLSQSYLYCPSESTKPLDISKLATICLHHRRWLAWWKPYQLLMTLLPNFLLCFQVVRLRL